MSRKAGGSHAEHLPDIKKTRKRITREQNEIIKDHKETIRDELKWIDDWLKENSNFKDKNDQSHLKKQKLLSPDTLANPDQNNENDQSPFKKP
jgi:hypothetical protein